MNILFTCAGRRNYLLRYFKDALAGLGKIVGVDSNVNATALREADIAIVVPGVYEDTYISSLLRVCIENQVTAVISLNDIELPILKNRDRFSDAGITLLLSCSETIDICSDKARTAKFLVQNGFHTPRTFLELEDVLSRVKHGDLDFPLIVKPRWGSASIGIRKVNSIKDLKLTYDYTAGVVSDSVLARVGQSENRSVAHAVELPNCSVIVQEWITGEEYGLDVLNDLQGKCKSIYAKRKLGMRAGETDSALLTDCPKLERIGERLGETLGHIGNLDVDVFKSNLDGRYLVLELNPRFGGGYPFSHELGARYPQALVSWLSQKPFDSSCQTKTYKKVIAKCDRLIEVG